jgi:hypothetical protein
MCTYVHTLVLSFRICSLILMPPERLKARLHTRFTVSSKVAHCRCSYRCVLLLQVELYLVIMALFVAICRLLYKLLGEPGALLLQVLEVRSQRCIVLLTHAAASASECH